MWTDRELAVFRHYHFDGWKVPDLIATFGIPQSRVTDIVIGKDADPPVRCQRCRALCRRLGPNGICLACITKVKLEARDAEIRHTPHGRAQVVLRSLVDRGPALSTARSL